MCSSSSSVNTQQDQDLLFEGNLNVAFIKREQVTALKLA